MVCLTAICQFLILIPKNDPWNYVIVLAPSKCTFMTWSMPAKFEGMKGTGTAKVKSSAKERGCLFLGIHSESMAELANARVPDNISLVNNKKPGNMRSGKQGNEKLKKEGYLWEEKK